MKRSSRSGSCSTAARQELQRHRLTELQIVGAIDLTHAAAAEEADHPVPARQHGAGQETFGIATLPRRW